MIKISDSERVNALMSERANIIANHREQLAKLTQIKHAARFLIERLDDFARGGLSDSLEDACRDFDGHVSPALERLRSTL